MKFTDDVYDVTDYPHKIVPCPTCGSTETSWLFFWKLGHMDIMCWETCGTDFRVPGIYWTLNCYNSNEPDQ